MILAQRLTLARLKKDARGLFGCRHESSAANVAWDNAAQHGQTVVGYCMPQLRKSRSCCHAGALMVAVACTCCFCKSYQKEIILRRVGLSTAWGKCLHEFWALHCMRRCGHHHVGPVVICHPCWHPICTSWLRLDVAAHMPGCTKDPSL